jgi:hypothetical protein
MLLLNRLVWTGLGVLLLVLTLWRFQFVLSRKKAGKKKIADDSKAKTHGKPADFSHDAAVFTSTTGWNQFLARVRFEVRGVLTSVFFWVLVALAVAISLGNFFALNQIYGTEVYPVTRAMINIMSGTVTLSLMVILVFYGADLVWRDREWRRPGWSPSCSSSSAAIATSRSACTSSITSTTTVVFSISPSCCR